MNLVSLNGLPDHILVCILTNLCGKEILCVKSVCRRWYSLISLAGDSLPKLPATQVTLHVRRNDGGTTDQLEPITDQLEPITDQLEPITDQLEPITDQLEPITLTKDLANGDVDFSHSCCTAHMLFRGRLLLADDVRLSDYLPSLLKLSQRPLGVFKPRAIVFEDCDYGHVTELDLFVFLRNVGSKSTNVRIGDGRGLPPLSDNFLSIVKRLRSLTLDCHNSVTTKGVKRLVKEWKDSVGRNVTLAIRTPWNMAFNVRLNVLGVQTESDNDSSLIGSDATKIPHPQNPAVFFQLSLPEVSYY